MVSTMRPQSARNIWLALRVLVVFTVVEGFRTGRIQTVINWVIDKTYHTTVDILFFGGLVILMAASVTLLVLLLVQFGPKEDP